MAVEPRGIELWLVRHGETVFNRENRLQGQADAPLTARGRAQAAALAARLCRKRFDALYSSDLNRARETVAIVNGPLGIGVSETPLLRERHFGEAQGLLKAEAFAQFPALTKSAGAGTVGDIPPGAERVDRLLARTQAFLRQVEQNHASGSRLLIVAHGGSIRGLVISALGLSAESWFSWPLHNAALTILELGTPPRLLLFNDTGHLDSEYL